MKTPAAARFLVRTTLSCGALAAFLLLLSNGPFVPADRRDPQPQPTTPRAAALPEDLTINGLPIRMKESQTSSCDAMTWDPFAAGYCEGTCTRVAERRDGSAATFAWIEKEADRFQALTVDCGTGSSPGRVSQLSILSAAGLGGFGSPGAGPRLPRIGPIPALPGSTEIANLKAGAMTILVDRPRHPGTALEELQLILLAAGWRRVGDPAAKPPQSAPPTWVFVRGFEVCVATLTASGEDTFLISAYSRDGWAPEIFL